MNPESNWKRISNIVFWLLMFTPWGLWLLYRDPVLPRPTKQRILLYTIGLSIALMLAFTAWEIQHVEKALSVIGG